MVNVVTGKSLGGQVILIAANGDQLFVDLLGQPVNPFVTKITGTIVGGTGRFTGASGSYSYRLETKLPNGALPNSFTGRWHGKISSVGSTRRG